MNHSMPVCPAVSPIVPNIPEFEAQDLSGHEDSMIRVARDAPDREDASGNDGRDPQVAQRPEGRPAPGEPTPEEYARHMLTHIPFRRWCRWCAMARMRNVAHFSRPPVSREFLSWSWTTSSLRVLTTRSSSRCWPPSSIRSRRYSLSPALQQVPMPTSPREWPRSFV